jgi:hypothetical protein
MSELHQKADEQRSTKTKLPLRQDSHSDEKDASNANSQYCS